MNKLAIGIGLAVGLMGAALAQEVKCPSRQGKNPLSGVSVFDGPPAEQADLVPDVTRGSGTHLYMAWDIIDEGRGVYVVCRYPGHGNTPDVTVKLDKKIKRCVFQAGSGVKPADLTCK